MGQARHGEGIHLVRGQGPARPSRPRGLVPGRDRRHVEPSCGPELTPGGSGGGRALSEAPKSTRFGINTLFGLLAAVSIQILGWIGTKSLFVYVVGTSKVSPALELVGIATTLILTYSVVTGIGGCRISSAYTFFVARGADRKPLTGTYIIFHLISYSVLSSSILLLTQFLNWFPPGFLEAEVLLIVVVPLLHVTTGAYLTERTALGRAAAGQLPAVVESIVRMVAIVYVALQYTPCQPPLFSSCLAPSFGVHLVTQIAWAYVLGSVAGFVVSLPVLRDFSPQRFLPTLRDLFTYATPLMAAMLLTFSVTIITPFILRYLAGSAIMQVFTTVNAFLILLMFLPNAVILPLFPNLARLHAEGRMDELKLRVSKAIRYTFLLLAPGMIAFSVFRVPILDIAYSGSVVPYGAQGMIVISLAALPMSLFLITGTTLDSVGLQRREFYASSVQLATLVVSLFIFVPFFGRFGQAYVVGATVSMVLGSIAGLAMNAFYLHRHLPIHIPVRSILTVLLASVATFAVFSNTVMTRIGLHLNLGSPYILAPVMVLGLVVYAGVLMLIGELSKEDVIELTASAGLPPSFGKALSRLCWKTSSAP
ncbi:MAG: polysaccharide biosynthesis C-terminal domain-containing protein [Candidatus Thermoplasmatota archaeon]|nr:polysaccharide biosynthesis C-terminal domain-containing protein [Candidatus Thermoplasmatota archaeon]MCL5984556.1 polysaccharide biosynthesis C-terminal domain-containing protein [Candidatus Thermoplasmatota archaeon]